MAQRRQLWLSRRELMARARAKRENHIRTAHAIQRQLMSWESDKALACLYSWDQVLAELRAAKVYAVAYRAIRGLRQGERMTLAGFRMTVDLARIEVLKMSGKWNGPTDQ